MLHAFTGCDVVSAFAGKGKAQALKMATEEQETRDMFINLGQQCDVNPQQMDKLETLTCRLYAPKTTTTVVNDLRYQILCAKRRGKELSAASLQGLTSKACTECQLSSGNM